MYRERGGNCNGQSKSSNLCFEAKLGGDAVALKTAKDLSGVVFGKQGGKYATMPETTDGHVLIVGGAGSGKTAAVAIPTLMSWKERVFAIDIKGELYAKTKKARGEAQIKVFNPTDTTAYGYDPFYMLKNADDISSAARQLAMSIVPLPADVKDPFWIKGAQNMLTGFLIYFQGLGESFSSTMKYIKSIPTGSTTGTGWLCRKAGSVQTAGSTTGETED